MFMRVVGDQTYCKQVISRLVVLTCGTYICFGRAVDEQMHILT